MHMNNNNQTDDKNIIQKPCGIVMPIAATDGCTESHWKDVLDILLEAIELAGFNGNLVSNANDVGIIHKRIIQNLYDNPIVVCDVSGKNPNVMFELGMRLAFDKPTIIVKDDKTPYSFDTTPIEHIGYPRDLRFGQIKEFKNKLSEKIRATYEKSQNDDNYTTFLKHFGEFKVAKIEQKEVSRDDYILDEIINLRTQLNDFCHLNFNRQFNSRYAKKKDTSLDEMSNNLYDLLKTLESTDSDEEYYSNIKSDVNALFDFSDERRKNGKHQAKSKN